MPAKPKSADERRKVLAEQFTLEQDALTKARETLA